MSSGFVIIEAIIPEAEESINDSAKVIGRYRLLSPSMPNHQINIPQLTFEFVVKCQMNACVWPKRQYRCAIGFVESQYPFLLGNLPNRVKCALVVVRF